MSNKAGFIRALADYLVTDQARRSLQLSINNPEAKLWQSIRLMTPISGYITKEKAERELANWLGIDLDDDEDLENDQTKPTNLIFPQIRDFHDLFEDYSFTNDLEWKNCRISKTGNEGINSFVYLRVITKRLITKEINKVIPIGRISFEITERIDGTSLVAAKGFNSHICLAVIDSSTVPVK